jgi:hypothetical protein
MVMAPIKIYSVYYIMLDGENANFGYAISTGLSGPTHSFHPGSIRFVKMAFLKNRKQPKLKFQSF